MTVARQSSGPWSRSKGPSDLEKPPQSGPENTRTSLQGSSWASYSRATMSGKQGASEQQLTGANKDEYLMNLFRREDMGYTNAQPSNPSHGGQAAMPGQSGQQHSRQPQALNTFPMSLPGYPGCGQLPQNRAAAPVYNMQQQQPSAALPAIIDRIKEKVGTEDYGKLRHLVLHHQETFVEQLYDLHRLVRRQQHLEANCRQREAYNAELHRLEAAQQGSGQADAGASDVEAAWQARTDMTGANHRSGDPSTERKGSNTPGENSDQAAANGSRQHGDSHSREQLQGLGVAASMLQQQHQNLEAAQAHAAAAAMEVQRQQGLLAHAQAGHQHTPSQQTMTAAAQAQAAVHQRTMDAAAESHMQHQQFMAAAAQAHLQHRQDMTAAAHARAQQQADIAEAQIAYGGSGSGPPPGSGGGGGSSGHRGTDPTGSGQNGSQSMRPVPLDASRRSYMQGAGQQNSSTAAHANMGQSGFPQGYNSMGMPNMMNGYGYGFGNYGNFYPGFGGYPNMSGYNFNPYSMAGAAGAMGCDPMQSWYMHHYGRGAAQATADAEHAAAEGAAAVAEAAADAQAQAAQQEMDAAAAREQVANGASLETAPPAAVNNAPRWWQDPAQVFGPEVLPEVVARMTSRQRQGKGVSSASARYGATASRPGSKHDRQKDEWEAQGERAPHNHASKKSKTGSGGWLEATGQTTDNSIFGSGGSAFRKIPQRPRSVRSTGRASSIGSENSKSSFGGNPQNTAAQQANGGTTASPPKQMESAANILVAFSGHPKPQP